MIKNFKEYYNQACDIVILAGQSNGQGCGVGPVDEEFLEDERVLMMSDTYPYGYKTNEAGVTYMDAVSPTITQLSIAKELDKTKDHSDTDLNNCSNNLSPVKIIYYASGGKNNR